MSYGGRNYSGVKNQQSQNQDWLEKMKSDRQAGTGAYAIKQGGPNVAQYPNQQQGQQGQYTDAWGRPMSVVPRVTTQQMEEAKKNYVPGQRLNFGQPQTDPYQLPQKPQFSTSNGVGMNPGQPQISTVGNPNNRADINPYMGPSAGPRPQQPPFAPGQQAYNGPKIKPVGQPPQSAFGQQNPTIFNPNFAQSPYGQSQMPYQPRRTQFQPPQSTQWGY